jgi:WD40 repeat protein
MLVAGYGEHTIQLFRANDGYPIQTIEGHTGAVKSLAVLHDNRLLVSGSFDRTVRIWRFPHGSLINKLDDPRGEILTVASSPDGRWLAGAGADRAIFLWGLPEGSYVNRLEGHDDTITSISISPDQHLLASCGRDQTVRLWSFPDGYLRQNPEKFPSAISTTCFHPDGKFLVCGCLDGSVSFISTSTGKCLATFAAHQGMVTGIGTDASGETLITSGVDRSIRLWDLRTLILCYLPISPSEHAMTNLAYASRKDSEIPAENQRWIEFFLAQVRRKQRYDISIDAPEVIQAGEYDIEIDV